MNDIFDIVILDSCVHSIIESSKVDLNVILSNVTNELRITHADKVFHVLEKNLKQKARCLNLVIEGDEAKFDLLTGLQFVLNNIDCKIISISAGMDCCDAEYRKQLYIVCKNLYKKGIIIVAGFSNMGRISYPAAFDCVIGVDMSLKCKRIHDFETVYSDMVNIRGTCIEQSIIINNKKYFCGGTSFIVPLVVAEIYNNKLFYLSISEILDYFSSISRKVVKIEKTSTKRQSNLFTIQKAIAFPFNKEIRNIARNLELINFEIIGFFDHKSRIRNSVTTVKNYESINWMLDFDTIILGHLEELSIALRKNLLEYFIEKAIKYQKKVVFFDILDENTEQILKAENIPFCSTSVNEIEDYSINFGKLYNLSIPVIAIMGTRPKQGKFTLQMQLSKCFHEKGYNIGLLGSEPISMLLGADATVICGYGSSVKNNYDLVYDVNSKLFAIEEKGKEAVIIASQSQTIPAGFGNLAMYPLYQESILLGSLPDCVILCINYNDNIEYIDRTIKYIESFVNTKVIAIRIFNFSFKGEETLEQFSPELMKAKEQIAQKFNIPVFLSTENVLGIADAIISYLE